MSKENNYLDYLYKSSQLYLILFDRNFPGPLADKVARNSSALNGGRGGGSKNGEDPSDGVMVLKYGPKGAKKLVVNSKKCRRNISLLTTDIDSSTLGDMPASTSLFNIEVSGLVVAAYVLHMASLCSVMRQRGPSRLNFTALNKFEGENFFKESC
ncbi:hypothetical protein PanWU01x14_140900 [Parasponia andersonii]|uniref:Uncharacterized protein n=1 Tax=Parasponia andersonii TaxID=3476 RepID=A0A2P5CM17_PARAD|nr:hypothetical protein PanWU01x14_140900 [Parasponia andersonii]